MSSKYDHIETPKELLFEVQAHGLSLKQDDICRVQDIFGNAPICDLVALANDNGRNDANGNPDPNGTWSSGRRGTQHTFYSVLFHIWNWEDAIRFYNDHTNHMIKEMKADNAHLKAELAKEHQNRLNETAKCLRCDSEVMRLGAELHNAQMDIMELKAKLYDILIEKGKGGAA